MRYTDFVSTQYEDLQANLQARRERAAEAQDQVDTLTTKTAAEGGAIISSWLVRAYGLVVSKVLPPGPFGVDCRILEDTGQRSTSALLLITMPGLTLPTWRQFSDAAALAWKSHVDSVALATGWGVDEDQINQAEQEGVKLWGAHALEVIYQNIEHETPGVSIFS